MSIGRVVVGVIVVGVVDYETYSVAVAGGALQREEWRSAETRVSYLVSFLIGRICFLFTLTLI
jgi:hypothetical protein